MSGMVERVARAIGSSGHAEQDGHLWDEEREFERQFLLEQARAAIAAMREPTDAMVAEGHAVYAADPRLALHDLWRAMVDAALTD